MDGLYFYWIGWMLWVIAAFFQPYSFERTVNCCFLLSMMTASYFMLTFDSMVFNGSFVIILLAGIFYSCRGGVTVINTFHVMLLSIGYCGFLLWELTNPVALIVPRVIVLPLLLMMLLLLTEKDYEKRLGCWCLSYLCGEFLYSWLLSSYSLIQPAGSDRSLDAFSSVIMLLLLLRLAAVYRIQKRQKSVKSLLQTAKVQ